MTQYVVRIYYTDDEGFTIDHNEELGSYDSKEDAYWALAEAGLTRSSSDVWYGPCKFGIVTEKDKL